VGCVPLKALNNSCVVDTEPEAAVFDVQWESDGVLKALPGSNDFSVKDM
jgi:hypothetical protein